ncbi:PREDICTED: uncharacterized protein LOC108759032 [Trachymyrmex cornetzi]|uniref:uncharacterized protein LOC108759032 n=1 Tax=Trachymyrmex cornetzi TaxID=471704 RepID=UPI00084F7DAD|nr:PREDICTED: uncharacterized protein LOC108759032 [Trachymyrmex cornetzi]
MKDMVDGYCIFDRCEKEALAMENINIYKLREFFGRHTLNGSSFRKLSVHVVGTPKEVAANAMNPQYFLKDLIIDDSQHYSATDYHITNVSEYKKEATWSPPLDDEEGDLILSSLKRLLSDI